MATCHICPKDENQIDDGLIFNHVMIAHPELASELERWPDGSMVIHDETLKPQDFNV